MSSSASMSPVGTTSRNGHVRPPRVAPDQARTRLLDGITCASANRQTQEVRAPFFDTPIIDLPLCTSEDMHLALDQARQIQPVWASWSVRRRSQVLLRFHDLLLGCKDAMMDLIQLETGKAREQALEEVMLATGIARYYAHRADRLLARRRHKGALPLLTKTYTYRRPAGVVGLISPWNYPLALTMPDALPALVAGNAVILKPAEQTSLTALLCVRLLHEAGLPGHVLQVVTGRGEDLGSTLIEGVDALSFTGSTATGRHIARQAGAHLVPCTMELGGKNALLVLDDADFHGAVDGIVQGSFSNAGQLCVSIERAYVPRHQQARFEQAVVAQTRALTLGAAFDFSADMGSLVSAEHLEKVQHHIEDAVHKGARVLCGGRLRADLGPYFLEPTVLADVTPDMTLYQEETFGPVVSLLPYDTEDEAVASMNDTTYGLNASIWTSDPDRATALAERLRYGMVNINEAYRAAYGSIDAPMGGMKASGMGRRHGAEGLLKYTEVQTVAQQRLHPVSFPRGVDREHMTNLGSALWGLIRYLPGLR